MKTNELDEKAQAEIARARELVKQAAAIVRRAKISDRALEFLRLADSNISHPEPMMWHDLMNDRKAGKFFHPDGHEIDHGNVFYTLDELSELCGKSRTFIRMLVNDGWMEQRHRGLYCLHDFFPAMEWYCRCAGRHD
jgi:Transcriptional regulator, AbiEi antitoxin